MKKLSEYAKEQKVTYKTAWNRYKAGKIDGAYLDNTGHVIIPEKKDNIDYKQCAIYCRVSSHRQKDDLNRQVDRVKEYAICNGYQIVNITKEIASGINDNRKGLLKLLKCNSWNILIVEHKDRLTRIGFNYIDELLKLNNKKIIVINQSQDDRTELMNDMISILYSFSVRLYGNRRKKKSEIKKLIGDVYEVN